MQAWASAVELAVRSFGGLDIVVNASGSETVVAQAVAYQALGLNAAVITVSASTVVVKGVEAAVRSNQINYSATAKADDISNLIVTMAGATFHSVNDAIITIG